MSTPRVNRELSEMLDQLDRQLTLLEQYCSNAFRHGRAEYLPEIAGKLRILLVRSKRNIPLLFRIAERLETTPTVQLDGPPIRREPGKLGPGDEITLDAFFDLNAVTTRTSAGLITMSKRELIRAWCEQLGGVHEDWAVDEALVNAIRSPIRIGGIPPSSVELHNCARNTLHHGRILVNLGRERQSAQKEDAPP